MDAYITKYCIHISTYLQCCYTTLRVVPQQTFHIIPLLQNSRLNQKMWTLFWVQKQHTHLGSSPVTIPGNNSSLQADENGTMIQILIPTTLIRGCFILCMRRVSAQIEPMVLGRWGFCSRHRWHFLFFFLGANKNINNAPRSSKINC